MNCKEHHLPELELATGQVREALQCILHTILLYVWVVFRFSRSVCFPSQLTCHHILPFFSDFPRFLPIFLFSQSIRSPGSVVPQDVECDGFELTYTRIAKASGENNHSHHAASSIVNTNVEKKVDDAIESFLRSLSQIGPELMSGCLVLSFFERRASKQLFGLVSHEERLVWVMWDAL